MQAHDEGRKNRYLTDMEKWLSYNGEAVYTIGPPLETTDETVVLLNNKFAKAKDFVQIGIDAEDYYRIKDAKKGKGEM